MIIAEISEKITLRKSDFPSEVIEEIKDALSIENFEKEFALRELIAGANDLEDFIYMYKEDKDYLYIPRGFKTNLWNNIDDLFFRQFLYNLTCDFSDLNEIKLRRHQEPAVQSIIANEQGIYKAPPGSGKTVTILEAIRRCEQRAIILVDKKKLATQWRDRAREFLGVEIGFIGDGEFNERDITVALKQTLYARADALSEQGFFKRWGFVADDECHAITCDSYQFVIQKFSPKYLIGVSATPARDSWNFPIALFLLGPVFHETFDSELVDQSILIIPKVIPRITGFEFEYRPTRINNGGYRIQNNYSTLIKELINNTERNELIVADILDNIDNHNLVISKRLNHLSLIKRKLSDAGYPHPIFELIGEKNSEEADKICEYANNYPCTVLSTIADQGLDVPRLDRLFMIFPARKTEMIKQKIGRIVRAAPGKKDALVYDYYDQKCPVLKSQFKERNKEIYRPSNLLAEI